MTQNRAARIRFIYGTALSLVIGAAGICLMAACLSIYRSGDKPFSREAVAAAFAPIAIPVYLCLAMVILGFVLELLLPAAKKTKAVKDRAMTLQRLHEKADLTICGPVLKGDILAQQKKRKNLALLTAAALTVGSVIFLSYSLNGENFHQSDITSSVVKAVYMLLGCMGVPFALAVYSAYVSRTSMDIEIELVKQAPKAQFPKKPEPKSPKAENTVRWLMVAAAVAVMVYGFFAGGTADVLTKAVNICTECVGLG